MQKKLILSVLVDSSILDDGNGHWKWMVDAGNGLIITSGNGFAMQGTLKIASAGN
jgi:uncharacterized protein YegP (UPF0339 family)